MLRRRIFASAMASVMALTSVAVVASADETVAAESFVKTKADLETYVKSFDSFRTNELYDYGSISNDNFNKALDFAQNVLDDPESTVDDYTVAYMTLKTVYDHLAIYTADQLKTLIDSCKKIYETDNLYNEEMGDEIYKNNKDDVGTGATFDEFVDRYEDALRSVGSTDSRIITDAYEELNWAKTTLTPYPTVTKAQFRTALKSYETALQKEYNYESWTTGKIVDPTFAVQWAFEDKTYAWGLIYDACTNNPHGITQQNIEDRYEDFDKKYKNSTKTSNKDIVDAYNACVNYSVILSSFVSDSSTRGSAKAVENLIKDYKGQLVHDYATTTAEKLFDAIESAVHTTGTGKKVNNVEIMGKLEVEQINDEEDEKAFYFTDDYSTPWAVQTGESGRVSAVSGMHPGAPDATKTIYAGITIKPTVYVYVAKKDGVADIYDADGNLDTTKLATAVKTASKPSEKPADYAADKYFTINKGSKFDITSMVKVGAKEIVDWASLSPVDNHGENDIFDGDITYNATHDANWATSNPLVGSWMLMYYGADGQYTRTDGTSADAFTRLDKAMALAEYYLENAKDKEALSAQNITKVSHATLYDISTTGEFPKESAKGSSQEWAVVYNYLARALSDKYDATTCFHTKADVEKVIEISYDLAEITGDSSLFEFAHNELVEARQTALDWVKAANKDKGYEENKSSYKFNGKKYTADAMFHYVDGKYGQLKRYYEAFTYGYGEMYNKVSEIADLIDSGEIQATEEITNGMYDILYRLFTLRSLDDAIGTAVDNDVFDVNAYFQHNNRVYTYADEFKGYEFAVGAQNIPRPDSNAKNITWEHNELAKAYEALVAAVKAQTDPTVVLGDVNGDGAVTAADASEILKAVVGLRDAISNEVGDFNGDGSVTSADAAAILKSVIGL